MSDTSPTTKSLAANLCAQLHSQVHVWYCLPLDIRDKKKLATYKAVLSDQEQERYQRFHFEKDRHSYLVSHALLRYALSQYFDVLPARWQFSANHQGKPSLSSAHKLPEIYFNLSHTDGLSACVITANRECGIDVEHQSRNNNLQAVAQRMFAEEERAGLNQQNIEQKFYALWTLREAYVKALGSGLSGSSKEFYFDVNKQDLSVKLFRKKKSADNRNWQFHLHHPATEHVLALAYESPEEVLLQIKELIP